MKKDNTSLRKIKKNIKNLLVNNQMKKVQVKIVNSNQKVDKANTHNQSNKQNKL
jgi:hypothetical protein